MYKLYEMYMPNSQSSLKQKITTSSDKGKTVWSHYYTSTHGP